MASPDALPQRRDRAQTARTGDVPRIEGRSHVYTVVQNILLSTAAGGAAVLLAAGITWGILRASGR